MLSGGLACELTDEVNLSVVFDMIKGGVDSGSLSVENSKLAAIGLPSKRYDAFWEKNNKNTITLCQKQCCYSVQLSALLPFISTTSTGTCFSLMRKISKLVTTP